MSPTAVSEPKEAPEPSLKKPKVDDDAEQVSAAAAEAEAQPKPETTERAAEPGPETPEPEAASTSVAQDGPQITFKLTYGKTQHDVTRPANSTVKQLRQEVEKVFGVVAHMQKLMCKGKNVGSNDADTLEKTGIKNGSKVLLIGSSRADVEAVKPKEVTKEMAWDALSSIKEEPICKQTQHAKVLAKGRPDDGIPGIKDRQVTMPESMTAIPGLMNSQGNKVRLTFREELQQLWIGSATSTQKVPYGSISRIESYPIDDAPEYSIVALCLGSSTSSRYWLYWFPSQHVAALKMRIIGITALI